jgi:lipopolysaccharide exporter
MLARGVAWNAVTGVGARLIGLVGTLVLTRFISPFEYGEVSTAVICVATAGQFSNLELGQYLIVRDYRERGLAFHALSLHVALGVAALGVVFVSRDSLGHWFGAPAMGRFVPGFVVAAAMERLSQVPEKMLARDLRFRLLAVTRGAGELMFTALAVSFAPSYGATAIVFGNIGRSLLVLVAFLAASERRWLRPARLSWPVSVSMLRYSVPLAAANMMDFASSKWDNLLISRFHGAGVMGSYNLAYNLSQTSTLTLADSISDVLCPSFARLKPERRGPALVRAVSVMAFIVSPLAFGLAAVARTLVSAVFPERWALIGPMLVVLSVFAAAHSLRLPFVGFYKAQNRTAFIMTTAFVRLVLLLGALLAIGRLGPLWACAAVDLAFVGHLLLMWAGLLTEEGQLNGATARGMLMPLLACVPMIVFVLITRAIEPRIGLDSPRLALGLEVAMGALGFCLGAAWVARETCVEVLGLVRGLFATALPARDSGHSSGGSRPPSM